MIHVYTGNGKGKTTAALGLAVRAAGAGKRVYVGQFIKGKDYSEIGALKKIKGICIEQFGRGCFITRTPGRTDKELAKKGLSKIKKILSEKKFGIVILDEINIALHLGLLETEELIEIVKSAPPGIEVVLTGRCAPAEVIQCADLVSEIKEIKHYFKKGVKARRGIEY